MLSSIILISTLYYKSATLCFFSKVLVTKINRPGLTKLHLVKIINNIATDLPH